MDMSQQEVWDVLAMDWAKFRTFPQEGVMEFLKDKKGLILDVGCGTGRNLIPGKNFVALDNSRNMLYIAQKKLIYRDDIDFTRGDATVLPFRSRCFDSALAVSVLHTVYKKEQTNFLKELNRVMKPGGQLLITVWNKRQPRFFRKGKEAFVDWQVGEKNLKRYYYLFDKRELEKLLKSHGFEIIDIKGSGKKSMKMFSKDLICVARKKR